MKSKQLANFLIKVLGIYFIYQNSIIFIAQVSSSVNMYIKYPANENAFIMFSGLGLGSLVVIIASMLLIFKSKSIASFLFRNEEDEMETYQNPIESASTRIDTSRTLAGTKQSPTPQ